MIDRPDRIPFTLLGGYLGAGKTTLVNRLLTAPSPVGRRIAVLVNDLGAVGVDAALIVDHDGPTLALANGCVCCAVGDDLAVTLDEVRAWSPPPDRVVMELSGVGEPARLAAWANTTGFRLDGIVVAADADQIVELAGRRYVGDTVRAQLMAADLVVLTKTDLADRPALARRFVERSTAAPVFDGARLDPMALFGVGGAEPMLRPPGPDRHGPDRHGPDRHGPDRHGPESVDVSGLRRAELAAIVDGLDDDVVRAKGVIRCVDVPALVEVQVVGRRRVLRERPDLSTGHDVLVVIRQPA